MPSLWVYNYGLQEDEFSVLISSATEEGSTYAEPTIPADPISPSLSTLLVHMLLRVIHSLFFVFYSLQSHISACWYSIDHFQFFEKFQACCFWVYVQISSRPQTFPVFLSGIRVGMNFGRNVVLHATTVPTEYSRRAGYHSPYVNFLNHVIIHFRLLSGESRNTP